jgi:hypothetical protein
MEDPNTVINDPELIDFMQRRKELANWDKLSVKVKVKHLLSPLSVFSSFILSHSLLFFSWSITYSSLFLTYSLL